MAMFMLAQEFAKRRMHDIDVDSAGTMRHEKPMTPLAIDTLAKHGVAQGAYVSKFAHKEIFDNSDFVFVMTEAHKLILENMYGENKKIVPMSFFLGREVTDPYGLGEDAYEQTFADLKEAIPKIADFLKSKQT